MLRPPPTSTLSSSSAASDVYKRQELDPGPSDRRLPPLRHRRRARAPEPDLDPPNRPDRLLLPPAEAHHQGTHRGEGDQEVRHRHHPASASHRRGDGHEDDENRPDQALHQDQPRRRATRDPGPDRPAAHLDPGQESTPNPTHHPGKIRSVSYTHLRAHETRHELVCRLL